MLLVYFLRVLLGCLPIVNVTVHSYELTMVSANALLFYRNARIPQVQLPPPPCTPQTKTDRTSNNVGCYVTPSLIITVTEESRDPARPLAFTTTSYRHLCGLRYGTRHQSAINFRLITHTDADGCRISSHFPVAPYTICQALSEQCVTSNGTPPSTTGCDENNSRKNYDLR